MDAKGWYSRRYIPHFDTVDAVQMFTFRLADSIPAAKLTEWKMLLANQGNPEIWDRVEKYLDAGFGSCVLGKPEMAKIVEDALLYFDGERYRLLAWVVMPNHVHLLSESIAGHSNSAVTHSWKSFTSHEINKATEGSGPIWQQEVFDRFTRSEEHLQFNIRYIHENPVKAGLVERAEDWPFSSARRR